MTGNAFGCIIASATIYVTAAAPGSIHSHVLQSIIKPSSVLKPSTLTVPVDHYNKRKLTSETWEMRYWYDDSHLKKGREGSKPNAGAPVFLQMGGEGEAGPAGGQQVELAGVHGAYSFSTAELGTLSAEQALADAAYFVRKMRELHNLTAANKWVTF
eukprot:gene29661-24775_t